MSQQVKIGYGLAGLFYGACLVCALYLGSDALQVAVSVAVTLAGGVLGWIAGILITPAGNEEQEFERLTKSIGIFLTGFVLARADEMFPAESRAQLLFNPVNGGRVVLFVTTFGLGALCVFVGRRYWPPQSAS